MMRIVVGVDGSPHAEEALRWAIAEAETHDATVVALMAWSDLDEHPEGLNGFGADDAADSAGEALAVAVEWLKPACRLEQRVVCELPARALLEAGADADLLVVGARGLGGFEGLLLGSVSERVMEQATVPVAVVREGSARPPGGAVVVGIDGSERATTALRWAAAEAQVHSAPLHVVHAWRRPAAAPATRSATRRLEATARQVLDRALRDAALSDVDVEGHLVAGSATEKLLHAADGASLVVVGTRGLGAFGRIMLGSTSRQLAHHAPCPVVVVPMGAVAAEGGAPGRARRG